MQRIIDNEISFVPHNLEVDVRVVRRLDQKWGLVTDSEGRVTTAEQWEAIESAKTVYHGEVGAPFMSAPHMGGALEYVVGKIQEFRISGRVSSGFSASSGPSRPSSPPLIVRGRVLPLR